MSAGPRDFLAYYSIVSLAKTDIVWYISSVSCESIKANPSRGGGAKQEVLESTDSLKIALLPNFAM
jgi:hypothetical protein